MAKGKKVAKKPVKKPGSKKILKVTAKPSSKKISKVTVKPKAKKSVKAKPAKSGKQGKQKVQPKVGKIAIQPKVSKLAIQNWDEILSPVDDRMLVEVISPAGGRITAGGLIIPDTVAMTGYKTAKVLSVGPGRRDKSGKRHGMGVEKNETIIFEEYSGVDIKIFERELKLVKESEILGIKTK